MASPREYLLLRLWGPMGSWGTIAVGEQRRTWTRPSRSAVLGLVAAALGYERREAHKHARLERGIALAVRVDEVGRALRDYHTSQTPQSESGRRWRSRADELLNAKKLNTILSDRDYLIQASAVLALWSRQGSEAPLLGEIEARLRRPVFALYLGRKAAPMGLPLSPRIVSAENLAAAFRQFDAVEVAAAEENEKQRLWLVPRLERKPEKRATFDIWLGIDDLRTMDEFGPDRIEERTQRRDSIRDRRTWTFEDRLEVRVRLEAAP